MAREIERKFLVTNDAWRAGATGEAFRQGYLTTDKARVVRVRTAGRRGYLTIKGLTIGISRTEFEYEIPVDDAAAMLDTICLRPIIEKTRYRVPFGGLTWEIDEFHGENAGLVMAEVELTSPTQPVSLPPWAGPDVSDDPRYFNVNLIQHPFKNW